jgi:hypothetical protein
VFYQKGTGFSTSHKADSQAKINQLWQLGYWKSVSSALYAVWILCGVNVSFVLPVIIGISGFQS